MSKLKSVILSLLTSIPFDVSAVSCKELLTHEVVNNYIRLVGLGFAKLSTIHPNVKNEIKKVAESPVPVNPFLGVRSVIGVQLSEVVQRLLTVPELKHNWLLVQTHMRKLAESNENQIASTAAASSEAQKQTFLRSYELTELTWRFGTHPEIEFIEGRWILTMAVGKDADHLAIYELKFDQGEGPPNVTKLATYDIEGELTARPTWIPHPQGPLLIAYTNKRDRPEISADKTPYVNILKVSFSDNFNNTDVNAEIKITPILSKVGVLTHDVKVFNLSNNHTLLLANEYRYKEMTERVLALYELVVKETPFQESSQEQLEFELLPYARIKLWRHSKLTEYFQKDLFLVQLRSQPTISQYLPSLELYRIQQSGMAFELAKQVVYEPFQDNIIFSATKDEDIEPQLHSINDRIFVGSFTGGMTGSVHPGGIDIKPLSYTLAQAEQQKPSWWSKIWKKPIKSIFVHAETLTLKGPATVVSKTQSQWHTIDGYSYMAFHDQDNRLSVLKLNSEQSSTDKSRLKELKPVQGNVTAIHKSQWIDFEGRHFILSVGQTAIDLFELILNKNGEEVIHLETVQVPELTGKTASFKKAHDIGRIGSSPHLLLCSFDNKVIVISLHSGLNKIR